MWPLCRALCAWPPASALGCQLFQGRPKGGPSCSSRAFTARSTTATQSAAHRECRLGVWDAAELSGRHQEVLLCLWLGDHLGARQGPDSCEFGVVIYGGRVKGLVVGTSKGTGRVRRVKENVDALRVPGLLDAVKAQPLVRQHSHVGCPAPVLRQRQTIRRSAGGWMDGSWVRMAFRVHDAAGVAAPCVADPVEVLERVPVAAAETMVGRRRRRGDGAETEGERRRRLRRRRQRRRQRRR